MMYLPAPQAAKPINHWGEFNWVNYQNVFAL